ncbi:hypothetical protein AVEN_34220-1 [Araneus ventricosus]|uniref:Uncharacterized protein n=1 Tax=Araneus ventricosus TaxID=182803 RepID=A0A4Y2MKV8_ARAVE|nr:hypothetical protein AVEN_34220-1 [Araneus ventricosus]
MATQKSYQTHHFTDTQPLLSEEKNTTSHADDRPPTELYTEQSCAAPSTGGSSNYKVQFLTIYRMITDLRPDSTRRPTGAD